MFHTLFIAWSHIQTQTTTQAPVEYIFGPWIMALAVYLATPPRALDNICSDLLLMAMHVTALAILYPSPICFSCSLNALMNCIATVAHTNSSACAFTIAALAAAPALGSYTITNVTWAIAWTEMIHLAHKITWILI
jgi:hypothetical protein